MFLVPETIAFTIALIVMGGLGVMQLFGLSEFLDELIDVDMDGIDVDAEVVEFDATIEPGGSTDIIEIEQPSFAISALCWLQFGKVPFTILLAIFLGSFAISGFIIQMLAAGSIGVLLSGWLAAPLAFLVALPATRFVGQRFARFMPKEETTAIAIQQLIGYSGTITIGTAKLDRPAECRVRDEHGQDHYVRVIPNYEAEEFPQGTEVVLVEIMNDDSGHFVAERRQSA